MLEGDTRALMAACRLAEDRLQELMDRYGQSQVLEAFDQIIERSIAEYRKFAREVIPEGEHHFFDYVDEQYLPARYNTQSELVVEVQPNGPNQFTYELTSRSKCARTDHRLYFNNTASLTVCWSVRFSGRLNRHQRE